MANIEALQKAMNELSGTGFKLWCYFNKNQDAHFFGLSQKDCEQWGITKSSYYRALDELKEKRYLLPKPESNIYYFYEMPQDV